ncbi:winged helix-turn-helix domain-containing protein [Tissierella pigra]|uniref:Winged helix-turn-helix transcriptional regulator n=1 Tax=Tissierella pigra TaxID=2607614 RepID=A0A6N7XUE1_9FIRM|nr:winged helix-turn-helix domain-containing protein [Tissierella pigra]MSU00105.1 winged helix-turn-helix transcriptional regulator [Tissierella pigra]
MESIISCKIEYNKAIEFIVSILKYTNSKTRQIYWNTPDLEKDIAKGIMDFSPNKEVKDWLKYIDDNISPFFRNDLIFVTDETYRLLDVCLNLVMMEDIKDPLELIESLKTLDTSTMIEFSYKYYELPASLDDDIELKDTLTEAYSPEIASAFMQMKIHPLEYKNKLIDVLQIFYKEFYEPFEDRVYNYMDERLIFHNDLFKKDPTDFINTIGIGDYSKAIELHKEMIIYMSFYMDVGVIYFTFEDILVMSCGQTVEHRFENRKKRDTYKALFKALSDDKRIEILKLTSKRPWYNKELADYFHLTTATLSYHLNLLLDLEILNFEPSIINNRYYYTTNKDSLKKLFNMALEDLLD